MIPRKGLYRKPQNEIYKSKSKHKDRNHIQNSKLNNDSLCGNYDSRDSNQKLICESDNSAGLESICCVDLKKWNICPIF